MEQSGDDLFYKAAHSFILEDYNDSIESFTHLIETKYENKFNTLLYRGSALNHLRKYEEALKDLIEAEGIHPNSFEVFYKKGIAYFLGEFFLEASTSFKKALTLATSSEQREKLVTWMNKTAIEVEENSLRGKEIEQADTSNIKFIYNWYQTPTHLVVTVDCNTSLVDGQFDFIIDKKVIKILHKGKNTALWEITLSNSVNASKCLTTPTNKKVEFRLEKEVPNFDWVTLESAKLKETVSNVASSYPTSSKVKHDWSNLDKEITQELNEEAKNDPNAGMMKLFKDIYERSDENTRRAMMKSFQTSGGTVLSTNWDEVKEKDYEGKDRPEAPKGQEWRKDN